MTCRICSDSRVLEINKTLKDGASVRETARRFKLSLHLLNKHFKECIGGQPRKTNCKTCRHERVGDIDTDIRSGKPVKEIALQYGISYQSLKNHRRNCLGLYSKLEPAPERKGTPWRFRVKGSVDQHRCACGSLCASAGDLEIHRYFCRANHRGRGTSHDY